MSFDKLSYQIGDALSLPKGWEIKSLGEIADVEYGFTDKSTEEGEYRYVRITDINNNGELISTEKKYLKHSKEAAAFLLQDNDLLMARTGATFAKVLLYEDIEPSVFASYLIRIKFKENIENKLYWYFSKTKSYWGQANSLASGAAQPHFNGAAVKQVMFSYPKSLPEQKRIVSILDECFSAIELSRNIAEQNLKNAKELFETYLQGVFEKNGDGWEVKKLGEVCIVERGSSPRPIDKYQTDGPDGVNWIKIGDTRGVDKYIFSTKEKITKEGSEKSRYVKEGDFILSNSMSFGKPYIMKTEGYIHDGWFVLRLPDYLDKDYFYYLLTSPNVQEQIQSLGAGAIVKNISGDLVKKVDINYPKSLHEQQTIVRKLDALRAETQKLEAVYQKKILDLEELKKSILQKAFAGELKTEKAVTK